MYDWLAVQEIISGSVPQSALEKLRTMDREISADIAEKTVFLNRLQHRIQGLSSILEDDPSTGGDPTIAGSTPPRRMGEGLTLRQKVINVLHDADRPLSAKEISEQIQDAEYPKVWRLIAAPRRGDVALADEPFVSVLGEGRSRRYGLKSKSLKSKT